MNIQEYKRYENHYEGDVLIPIKPRDIFRYIDNPLHFSSHMNKSSFMMLGSSMKTVVDSGKGKKIGSHIRMIGKILGVKIFLDEIITTRKSPRLKVWKTVGTPKLIVVGHYLMKAEINPKKDKSLLRISIDYDFPENKKLMGILFGRLYARWCVKQMIDSVNNHFSNNIKK